MSRLKAPVLPALTLRSTRVRLLAWSYDDAATGSDDGGRGSKAESRIPGRNLELWNAGSYRDLERVTDQLRVTGCLLYRMFWELYTQRDWLAAPDGLALQWVTDRMPDNIYVPQDISEVAGYGTPQAKAWTKPRRLRMAV